jgi:hypothetical protein
MYDLFANVLDLTTMLRLRSSDPNAMNFNPSIAYIGQNSDNNYIYLYNYRSWIRFEDVHTQNYEGLIPNQYNMNHPWYNPFLWKEVKNKGGRTEKYDKTLFGLMVCNRDGMVLDFLHIPYEIEDGADARLIRLKNIKLNGNNVILCSYNTTITGPHLIENGVSCADGCVLIASIVIEVNLSGFNGVDLNTIDIKFNRSTILCPEFSKKVEKNWSIFENNNEIFFSYNIYPEHKVIGVGISPDGTLFCKSDYKLEGCYYINKFKEFWGSEFSISITTPLIDSVIIPGYKLAVGHVKWVNNLTRPYPPWDFNSFNQMHNDRKRVSQYAWKYLFYFYYFNTQNGKIELISDMFMMEPDSVLCFPSGLETIPGTDTFLLTYGSEDFKAKTLLFKEQELLENKFVRLNNCASITGNIAIVHIKELVLLESEAIKMYNSGDDSNSDGAIESKHESMDSQD